MSHTEDAPQGKISLPEGILITLALGIIDLIEIVILFFALDDFWIADVISSVIFFYLLVKGVPAIRQLIAWIAELVPYLGALPLLTVGWLVTWWIDAHPKSKVGQVIVTAAALVPSGKGAAGKAGGGVAGTVGETAAMETKTAATAVGRVEGATTAERGALGEVGDDVSKAAKNAEKTSEEAFGMPKEPQEKVMDIMKELPQPQSPQEEEEKEEYNKTDVTSSQTGSNVSTFPDAKNDNQQNPVETDNESNRINPKKAA